jgi:hypothetical protein
LFSIAMVFQFVIVWRFFPETKGKSLEAIQKEFDAKRIKITKPQVKILE